LKVRNPWWEQAAQNDKEKEPGLHQRVRQQAFCQQYMQKHFFAVFSSLFCSMILPGNGAREILEGVAAHHGQPMPRHLHQLHSWVS